MGRQQTTSIVSFAPSTYMFECLSRACLGKSSFKLKHTKDMALQRRSSLAACWLHLLDAANTMAIFTGVASPERYENTQTHLHKSFTTRHFTVTTKKKVVHLLPRQARDEHPGTLKQKNGRVFSPAGLPRSLHGWRKATARVRGNAGRG